MEHRLTIPLRWRDLDMLGHVNQSVYHELFEDARSGLVQVLLEPQMRFVLAHAEVDYRHEVRIEDSPVEVVARVRKVGTKSFTLEHELLIEGDTVAASGTAVCVAWDGERRAPRELTDDERRALTP